MSGKHVIVLNGKHYDTKTGKLISSPTYAAEKRKPAHKSAATHHAKKSAKHPHKPHAKHAAKPRSIDGISRSSHASPTAAHPTHARRANHAARKPQRSNTVMRAATKHPVIAVDPPVEQPVEATISTSPSVLGVDPARIERAKHIHQDKRISRFNFAAASATTETTPVPPEPIQPAAAVQPATKEQQTARDNPQPASHLEKAIASADSHMQPKHPRKHAKRHHKIARKLHMKPRTLKAATAAVLVIGVGGFLIRQNMPALQVQLASNRAGVSSSLPSYVPSGYDLTDGVDYRDGEVTLTYQSKAGDKRAFSITQSESFWTSEALRENYLENRDGEYQTVQQNGKTIYLYDNGATWVDGGVWYRIDAGEAELSSTQLSDLINGL